jgi:hypothetical protein
VVTAEFYTLGQSRWTRVAGLVAGVVATMAALMVIAVGCLPGIIWRAENGAEPVVLSVSAGSLTLSILYSSGSTYGSFGMPERVKSAAGAVGCSLTSRALVQSKPT